MAGGAPTSTFTSTDSTSKNSKYLFPLILVTSLFFMWGASYGLLDVLNKHFKEAMEVPQEKTYLIQLAYFGAYFIWAIPASIVMRRYSYKSGIILGLLLFATGAFLFYPSAHYLNYSAFLASIFVLASGLSFLETGANPYVTVLGSPATSERRLTLSQCFNGLGSLIGSNIGGFFFFQEEGSPAAAQADLSSVQYVYVILGVIVLLLAILFMRTKLPDIQEQAEVSTSGEKIDIPLSKQPHFIWSVIAQFFYVAAQVCVGAVFLNYATEYWVGLSSKDAAIILSIGFLLFTLGRFIGVALMQKIAPHTLLRYYALINIALSIVVMMGKGAISVFALTAIFFFMSIMFPTIFALGIKNLGTHTKRASSYLVMSIVGGALVPLLMGYVAKLTSTATGFIVPLVCFLAVYYFAASKYKVKTIAAH